MTLALWEQLEEFMIDNDMDGHAFTAISLGLSLDIPTARASVMIQSHLEAQASTKARTLYVLHRTGRTHSAVWHVGARAADARQVGSQAGDDFKRRVERAIEPTLREISVRNPHAMRSANEALRVIEGAVEMIAGMIED